jgi:hypothetical protein
MSRVNDVCLIERLPLKTLELGSVAAAATVFVETPACGSTAGSSTGGSLTGGGGDGADGWASEKLNGPETRSVGDV